ncbi:MAG: prolyl oligopeptidase family serine peptidase [Prosthecobacter sp.]|nr:prolyl oligopeptidase family serine peptidase [Prosthecobacter sp.]
MKTTLCLAVIVTFHGSLVAAPRGWTSSDGKSAFQGDLIEFTETEVKIKRLPDFQIFKVALERLSDADQKYINGLLRERWRDEGLKNGPYAEKMTGQLVKAVSKQGLNYQIQGDPKWDGKKRYPLLIWLHGSGQSGDDNTSQIGGSPRNWLTPESQAKTPFVFIAPQCPSAEVGWKNAVANNLMALIADLIERLPVDQNRIYLTGSSMGGFGTWHLIGKYPQVFAAGVPLCGGGDSKQAEVLKDIPMWVFHGDQDDMVPVERARTMVQAVKAAGGTYLQYTEFPGVGHSITGIVYPRADLQEWLFAQRRKRAE